MNLLNYCPNLSAQIINECPSIRADLMVFGSIYLIGRGKCLKARNKSKLFCNLFLGFIMAKSCTNPVMSKMLIYSKCTLNLSILLTTYWQLKAMKAYIVGRWFRLFWIFQIFPDNANIFVFHVGYFSNIWTNVLFRYNVAYCNDIQTILISAVKANLRGHSLNMRACWRLCGKTPKLFTVENNEAHKNEKLKKSNKNIDQDGWLSNYSVFFSRIFAFSL